MPTTADDLVVSLTIKPTSNLGRLQRQLEALVGKQGMGGAGIMHIKKDLNILKKGTREIKDWIRYLRPTHLPGSTNVAAQRAEALRLRADIRSRREALVGRFMKMRSPKKFMKDIGASSMEEVKDFFRDRIADWEADLEMIAKRKSDLTPKDIQNFEHAIDAALTNILTDKDIGKMLFSAINKSTPGSVFENKILSAWSAAGINLESQQTAELAKKEGIYLPSIKQIVDIGKQLSSEKKFGEFSKREGLLAIGLKAGGKATKDIKAEIEKEALFFGKENIMFLLRDVIGDLPSWLESQGFQFQIVSSIEKIMETATKKKRIGMTEEEEKEIQSKLVGQIAPQEVVREITKKLDQLKKADAAGNNALFEKIIAEIKRLYKESTEGSESVGTPREF